MNKVELLAKFNKFKKPFYTFSDLQLILGLKKLSANKRIIDLVNQGFLIKLGRNVFVPSFWEYDPIEVASSLNQPAYISFETALYRHGILSDTDDSLITLASFLDFNKRTIAGKLIIWSRIKKDLFWGFEKEGNIMMATAEKALLDLLYLASYGNAENSFDQYDLSKIDVKRFNKFLKGYPNQTKTFVGKCIHFD